MKRKQFFAMIVLTLVMAFGTVGVYAAPKTAKIRVEGMHCKMCAASITKALKATAGVESVEVSYDKGEAVVKYDDEKVTEARLREVINGTGFKAIEEKASR